MTCGSYTLKRGFPISFKIDALNIYNTAICFQLLGKLEKVIMHVEDQKRLLRDSHECTGEFQNVHRGVQPGRHAGRNKTMDAITGKYYWLQ